MLPKSRSARRLTAGAALAAGAVSSVLAVRGASPPWIPDAPAYRQKGPAQAKIVLVEFSDFQCPGCAAAVETVKRLEGLYGGHLRVVFKHRPWGFHPWAKDAAAAAECAGRQGRFWELHDLIFLKQREWSASSAAPGLFAAYARSVGVEPSAFARCLQDPASAALVESDRREAEERWINATPTFFLNGRRLVNSLQLRTAGVREIERLLR